VTVFRCEWAGTVRRTFSAASIPNAGSLLYALSGHYYAIADFGAYSLIRNADGSATATFPARVSAEIEAGSEAEAREEFGLDSRLPEGADLRGVTVERRPEAGEHDREAA
jgi:hypothetical protein